MSKAAVADLLGQPLTVPGSDRLEYEVGTPEHSQIIVVGFNPGGQAIQVQGVRIDGEGRHKSIEAGCDHQTLVRILGAPIGATRYRTNNPVIVLEFATLPPIRAMFFEDDKGVIDEACSFLMGEDGELAGVQHTSASWSALAFHPAPAR